MNSVVPRITKNVMLRVGVLPTRIVANLVARSGSGKRGALMALHCIASALMTWIHAVRVVLAAVKETPTTKRFVCNLEIQMQNYFSLLMILI